LTIGRKQVSKVLVGVKRPKLIAQRQVAIAFGEGVMGNTNCLCGDWIDGLGVDRQQRDAPDLDTHKI
jgi:hypothetical protein